MTRNPAGEPDGRRLRSERSKQAIIDAILALMEEGNLVPSAQTVADRAGIGIRSVFRHFADMEELYAIAGEQQRHEKHVGHRPSPGPRWARAHDNDAIEKGAGPKADPEGVWKGGRAAPTCRRPRP